MPLRLTLFGAVTENKTGFEEISRKNFEPSRPWPKSVNLQDYLDWDRKWAGQTKRDTSCERSQIWRKLVLNLRQSKQRGGSIVVGVIA